LKNKLTHISTASIRLSVIYFLALFYVLFSRPTLGQVYINEFLASNTSTNIDRDFGEFSDWIELYNAGDKPIDLGGYYLTNDPENLTKWRIPDATNIEPNGYKLFWADGENKFPGDTIVQYRQPLSPRSKGIINIENLHLNFNLRKGGSVLALFTPDDKLIDSVTYQNHISDITYGRNKDKNWRFFANATALMENDKEEITVFERSTSPQFSITGGFYKKSQKLILNQKAADSQIYYTLDGSKPTKNSSRYSNPLSIESTKVIKAITIREGWLPSNIETHTIFIKETYSLPVISISTKPSFLWGDDDGIYAKGKNGIADLIGRIANYNQDWERPAQIELFDESGQQMFNLACGIKINGILHQALPQKSLAIHMRNKYGSNRINYQLFPDKPIENFKTVLLRNSGADWQRTMFRDGMMNCLLINQMNIDYQAYRPVIIFLNGKYWGIQNLREKLNEHYPASNYNLDPNNIDMIETFKKPIVMNGDSVHYSNLMKFVGDHDLSVLNNYEHVQSMIDIDEFIDYNIAEIYFANHDWPGNNSKFWRPKTEKGKWRWIIVDTEFGFGLGGQYNSNSLHWATDPKGKGWNEGWSTLLLRSLLENAEFRSDFVNRFAHHLNITFNPSRVISIIDSLKADLQPDMEKHIKRWRAIISVYNWETNIAVMKEFAYKRPAYMRQYVINHFGLTESSEFAKHTVNYTIQNSQKAYLNERSKTEESFNVIESIGLAELMNFSLPEVSNNIKYSIDKIVENKRVIHVTGWAYIDSYNAIDAEKFIVLESDQLTYIFSTNPVKREGVTKHFNTLNFDDSGFTTLISKENLKPGLYNIGIYIAKKGDVTGFKFTNRRVKIGN